MDFDKHLLFHADKAGGAGGLRAMISAICVSCRDEEDCGLYSGNCDTYKQAVTKWNEMTKGKTND